MWTIGVADRLRFPRFPSKLGKRGNARFAHIPTGTTANKGIDTDDSIQKIEPLHQPAR